MPAFFFPISLPLVVGAKVLPAILVPVIAIHAILPVAIRADLLDPVPADVRRQLPIGDFSPGTVIVPGTMPAVAVVQIVIIRAEDDVIGGVYTDIKAESRWGDKVRCHIETD